MRALSSGLLVAVGTGVGNVLAYGFNLALSRGLGPKGYAELGTLLAVFLIGSVPGLAVQAVNARRLAVMAAGDGTSGGGGGDRGGGGSNSSGSPGSSSAENAGGSAAAEAPELGDLSRRLRLRGVLAGFAVALLFLAISPAISALLPSVTSAGAAWTGVSLAAYTVFSGYLGLAQGTQRFGIMTVLFLAAHSTRLLIGVAAAAAGASPTTVMAAQTGAWALAAVAGHFLLRGLTNVRASPAPADSALGDAVTASIPAPRSEPEFDPRKPTHGYTAELLRACAGLGGIVLLANLDVLLAGRYLVDSDLGRYNTAALISRAAFFAPAFVAILAYPRLARFDERRRALRLALAVTAVSGVFGVAAAGFGGDRLIKAAFGAKYGDSAGAFDLGSHSWVFAALGALLALVNLALLDGVARRSHVVSGVVLGGIILETGAIVGFAHHSPDEIVTTAACCALLTAVASVTACLAARPAPATWLVPPPKADAVGALPQTST
jgi:O-antigen/teichoic acid export membrane protein